MDKISIKLGKRQGLINPELHSQFIEHLGTCINGGIWVGDESDIPNYEGLRKDVVDALKKIAPPVIRWPGGCFADTYHWRNGVGPRNERPVTFNNNFGTAAIENNHFGTHEFMKLCRLVGAKPWLNVNMLSGSVAEMVEWAEYCNRAEKTDLAEERTANGDPEPFGVELWGIGNESWAGGGNYTPEAYVDEYRKYTTAFPSFGRHTVNKMIAVGPDGNKPKERVKWTERVFKALSDFRQPRIDAYDLHFYNWNIGNAKDNAVTFDEEGWYSVIQGALEIEEVIEEQYELLQKGLDSFPETEGPFPSRPASCDLYIGEWGNWHRPDTPSASALKNQSSMRDAITSAITLDIFHKNCNKVKLACVAQTVNVLNSLILTFGEDTVLSPTYHVFDMYKVHRGGQKLESSSAEGIYSFASVKDGIVSVNIVNADIKSARNLSIEFDGDVEFTANIVLKGSTPNAYNSPENPVNVVPTVGRSPDFTDDSWCAEVPPASVSVYTFRLK